MVKMLQKKFIAAAMAAVSVLLLVLIGTINVANCMVSSRQTNEQLTMLADIEKQVIKQQKAETEYGKFPNRYFHLPNEQDKNFSKGGLFHPPMDEDMAMSLRFFTVYIDKHDKVIRKDISRIASVSEEEAEIFAKQAVQAEKILGYLEHFKYQVLTAKENDVWLTEDKIIIFLDVSGQFRSIGMVIVLSISVGAVCWICMLLLVILLSKKAIRPIAQNIQKQRQFVTDAGHEIKTPLAIIQANIDAMELISGENKWSRNIRSQTVRLNGLMQNLLTLAKMDEESLVLSMEQLSLSDLLEDAIQSFCEAAALKHICLEQKISPEIFMKGNCEYIKRLISILLDNAVKYSSKEGKISILLKKEGHIAVLQIQNTCEQLPKDEAEKLFDRFYRGDSARTQKNGGYGIGLSAAYAIVKVHKGEISADYPDEHTIRFVVKI